MLLSPSSLLLVCLAFLLWASPARAFGAGHLTDGSHLDGRAFRHGDISEILIQLVKIYAGSQLARRIETAAKDGKKHRKLGKDTAKNPRAAVQLQMEKYEDQDLKFDPTDVARVYFGNWLRDMSQALDIGTIKSLGPGTLTNVVSILGFLAFDRGTREFEVTAERLGCYRHEEHIDNPFGYPDGEPPASDPRLLAGGYPGLRGPVRPIECEVDPKSGMKNYIANEDGDWDTSTAYLRKSLVEAIKLGREGLSEADAAEKYWEALRLLGQSLHVIEDFGAHSNFIQLALIKLGHKDVFAFVGENVRCDGPNGERVPILTTGTFGGADATHSLIGESVDKISGLGVSDMTEKLHSSKLGDSKAISKVFNLILPGSAKPKKRKEKKEAKEEESREKMKAGKQQDEEEEDPQETIHRLDDLKKKGYSSDGDHVHQALVTIFKAHDTLSRRLSGSATFDNDSGVLSTFIWATLEPIVSPLLKIFGDALNSATNSVVDRHKLNDDILSPDFDNPSHSILANDHLDGILNGPAGMLAQVMFRRTVNTVTEAWNNFDVDPEKVAREICSLLHNPFFADEKNKGQQEMLDYVQTWLDRQGSEKEEVLSRLTKQAILEHRNNTQGLKYGSTVNVQIKKPKKIQYARKGLFGLIGVGCGKIGMPCCKDSAHDSDLEDNVIED